jgi:hypothetical protein
MSNKYDKQIEELIFEDVQEWVEEHLLQGETWDQHFDVLRPQEYSKRLKEVMKIYWEDHIWKIQ